MVGASSQQLGGSTCDQNQVSLHGTQINMGPMPKTHKKKRLLVQKINQSLNKIYHVLQIQFVLYQELSSVVVRLLQQFDKPADSLPSKPSITHIIEALESVISRIPPANSQPIVSVRCCHNKASG